MNSITRVVRSGLWVDGAGALRARIGARLDDVQSIVGRAGLRGDITWRASYLPAYRFGLAGRVVAVYPSRNIGVIRNAPSRYACESVIVEFPGFGGHRIRLVDLAVAEIGQNALMYGALAVELDALDACRGFDYGRRGAVLWACPHAGCGWKIRRRNARHAKAEMIRGVVDNHHVIHHR